MIRPVGRVLTAARALGHALVLTRNHVDARTDAIERAREIADQLACTLDRDGDGARELVQKLAHELDVARDRAHDLSKVVRDFADVVRKLARARMYVFFGTLCRELDLVVARTLDLADALARDLRSSAQEARTVRAGRAQSMPGRVSRGLIVLAVLLLPIAQRRRYHEEFDAELADLPRRGRWSYSVRVLASARKLRRSLKKRWAP